MILRHIFSNINIPNLLHKIKKFFNEEHFLNIEETIQKFLACSLEKCFIIYQCPCTSLINSRSLVNPDFVLHAEKNTLLFGLKKRLALLLMSNTELFFLLFQKNLENFSSMIEIFLQNLHMLLMIFLNINSIISNPKKERVHKIGSILKNILLILILSITG